MRRRLVIVHPFVQAYRARFYERLSTTLAGHDLELVVAENPPAPGLAARGDSVSASWSRPVPTRWMRVGDRDVALRRLGSLPAPGLGDLLIVEQAVKNLETYPALVRQRLSGAPVAMWGHGRSYSTPQGPIAARAKQFLTRQAGWFFAYTQAGAEHVIAHGFPADRVTVTNNTIDTVSLSRDLTAVTDADTEALRDRLGLVPGRTALFLGGVDRNKGIDFLLAAAGHARRLDPDFVLLIGGAGGQLNDVRRAEARGAPIRVLGRLDGSERAAALRAADLLAIPEWIGLVAVDSLVSGRPIVSTWHPSHSPEHEYLEPGVTASFTRHDPVAYAECLISLLKSPARLAQMQDACTQVSPRYSLEHMVDRFSEGVLAWDAHNRDRVGRHVRSSR